MQVIAYLTFNGNAEEALGFYKQLFDGHVTITQRYGDAPAMEVSDAYKDKILHASLEFQSNTLFFSDNFENAPELTTGNVSLTLNFDKEEELERIYEELKEGAEIKMSLQHTFWDAIYASLIDRYGIEWSLNYSKE